MAVARFQDLIAWQKARVLTAEVYRVTRTAEMAKDFGLANQMQRAAVSVMANIAAGFERNRPAEFQRFLEIAKASNAELMSHFYVALDVGYFQPQTFQTLQGQCDEVSRIIGGLQAWKRRVGGDRSPTRDSGLRTGDS